MRFTSIAAVLAASLPACHSFTSTDFPQDGDVPQSGYSTNHNFDPALLGQYKLNWTAQFNQAETFYAKPLVYTPPGAPYELVYVVSNQNIIRVLDGMTGAVLQSRTLAPPFMSSDTKCGDIPNTIGIIGTPIIDQATDIMYFWSKSYMNGAAGPQGVENGNWKLYGIRISDLTDVPGFPVSIQGMNAVNDPTRYPISGTMNQRPGLAMIGDSIITGFGSHCNNFNVTGYLVTASKSSGRITDIQAMVASPGAPTPQALDLTQQRNGKSSIWQGGFGLAVDAPNNRIFFATGNGQSPGELKGDNGPVRSGKTKLSTLENSVASYSVDPVTGALAQLDWFTPTNYDRLNGADRDLGSSGVALLDPVFSGGGVNRIAVAAGKNGTIFVMDADNLGGFKNGPGQTDGVLQVIAPDRASFFSGVACYPGEGGYMYFVPTDDSIYAYKFGMRDGKPWFTLAGKTKMVFAGRGAPRITSLNGKPGTGIVWISDINQGVNAFNATPDADGILQPLPFPSTMRLTKFHRPSFGNGRVYTTGDNKILALGPPVAPVISSSANAPVQASTSSVVSTVPPALSTSALFSSAAASATTSSSVSSVVATSSTSSVIASVTSSSSTPLSSSSSSSSSSVVISSSSTSSAAIIVSSSSVITSTSGPATVSASTTSSSFSIATSSLASATPTGPYTHMGCYSDTSSGHALPLLFANNSVTPELCEAYVLSLASKPTPTVYDFYYLEYHHECYGGSSFNWRGSSVTPLTGAAACTDICSGSIGAKTTGTAMCGGGKQFNLYVRGGSSNLPPYWPGVSATTAPSSSTSALAATVTSAPLSSSSGVVQSSPSIASDSSSSTVSSAISSSSSVSTFSTVTTSAPASSSTSSVVTSKTSSAPVGYVTPQPPTGQRKSITWNIGWVNAAPDGHMRPLIGVNGQWPPPALVVNYGDILVLNVVNNLGNQSTSIHFHGLHQRNTTFEDGPTGVTQCPIPPGQSFVYQFTALQVGTYWYHSHHDGQYIDGLRGAFIVKQASPPFGPVDQDLTLTLADHYHEEAPYLIHTYQSVENMQQTGGNEPVPDSNLLNDAQNVQFKVAPGKTYLFRVINMGALAGQYLQFDQHNMTIVEVDGQYVEPYEVQQLFISVAQRYSVLVQTKADSSQNFAIVASMMTDMVGDGPSPASPTVNGWLVYDSTKPLPSPFTLTPQQFDDAVLVPLDRQPLLDPPSETLYVAADLGADTNGIMRSYLNGVSYVPQKVPTLFSVLSAPAQYVENPTIYGTGSNPVVLPYGKIVEIEITNHDTRGHPFHLHGHAFQLVYRSESGWLFPGLWDAPETPMKRDVVTVYAQGTARIRFVADNPGIQLFHCHTEWHVVSGMTITFIEAPKELVAQKPYIPGSHRDVCDKVGISRKGNAAGNSNNWLDLTGANTQASANNWGALINPPSS